MQFILTVVPTTGYGVVKFKILRLISIALLLSEFCCLHKINEDRDLGVGRIQFSLVFCIWIKTSCCCSTSPSARLVGRILQMNEVIEDGWNGLKYGNTLQDMIKS